MGAILTQRTSWHNADLALLNLKREGLLSFKKIADLENFQGLTELVRPAGFYQTKPRRLFELARFAVKECGGIKNLMREDMETARQKLLSLYGIGQETADVLLLYAFDKLSFVIDEYTKRFVRENNLSKVFGYKELQELFEKNLPQNLKVYQNFHFLIIAAEKQGKGIAMKRI